MQVRLTISEASEPLLRGAEQDRLINPASPREAPPSEGVQSPRGGLPTGQLQSALQLGAAGGPGRPESCLPSGCLYETVAMVTRGPAEDAPCSGREGRREVPEEPADAGTVLLEALATVLLRAVPAIAAAIILYRG